MCVLVPRIDIQEDKAPTLSNFMASSPRGADTGLKKT